MLSSRLGRTNIYCWVSFFLSQSGKLFNDWFTKHLSVVLIKPTVPFRNDSSTLISIISPPPRSYTVSLVCTYNHVLQNVQHANIVPFSRSQLYLVRGPLDPLIVEPFLQTPGCHVSKFFVQLSKPKITPFGTFSSHVFWLL